MTTQALVQPGKYALEPEDLARCEPHERTVCRVVRGQETVVGKAVGELAARLVQRVLVGQKRRVLRGQRHRRGFRLFFGRHHGTDVVAVLRHVIRPDQGIADKTERPLQSLQPFLQPMHLQVVLIARLAGGVIGRPRAAARVVLEGEALAEEHEGFREQIRIARRALRIGGQLLTEFDGDIVGCGLPDDIHDLEAQMLAGVKPGYVAEQFHEDAPLHIVGANLSARLSAGVVVPKRP